MWAGVGRPRFGGSVGAILTVTVILGGKIRYKPQKRIETDRLTDRHLKLTKCLICNAKESYSTGVVVQTLYYSTRYCSKTLIFSISYHFFS